ncbi:hypothetical protein LRP31_23640 [Mesorhizobium mediterraneum]|uniref:GNAT family N-acetyltransferase n=1 Tax=Mesorhizobium mediterraneum TaxID=43617 RepID=A0AB36R0S4_9HYPH|nr:hypothetical protein [Mesorhizobium mediterraneum]PAP97808.1 hypothetical protein CIT25_35060 [Mesorhizobium mediterraneum]WIW52039.1 hypothetical protein LRP31_23640 [Mesorhizobium mediterraneum]
MSELINTTIANPSPMDRMASSSKDYMAALEEYVSAKGLKPVWYSLADDADFNFGFVCRLEPA